jgi:hypothetical protein
MLKTSIPPAPRSAEPHREQKAIGTFQIPTALLDKIPEEHWGELFILILDGDCLEPEVHHDDRAIVAPTMPIRPGDFVVLWPKDQAHRPQMKRVVMVPMEGWEKFDPATWEVVPLIFVEQLNPPRQYEIRTDKLAAIHRVVTTFRPDDYQRTAIEPRPLKRQRRAAGGRR